jgi:predicted enzyme related to lactoylglutathione lyase
MTLNLLVIRTAQPEVLATFYSHLDLQFDYHCHGNGPMHYSADIDGLVFEIYPLLKNQAQADSSLRLGFQVKDLDKLLESLKKEKINILQEPKYAEWGYFAVIRAPDGRKIELTQTK